MALQAETVDGFKKTFTYSRGQLASVAYSKNNSYICTENLARMNGHLTSVTLGTGDTLWTLRAQNARLLPTRAGLGRLNVQLSYDLRGNVTSREVVRPGSGSPVQSLEYGYNAATGDMAWREDWNSLASEQFGYDGMSRLTSATRYSPYGGYTDESVTYDGKGNILERTDAGLMSYGTAGPYAMNQLSQPTSQIPMREQRVSYNAMQRPDTISEGQYSATLSYYGDMTRASMNVTGPNGLRETHQYHDGSYTETWRMSGDALTRRDVLWLGGSPYDAPAAMVRDNGGQWRLVHVLRDNLGSITHVVDTTGVVLQEMSYTAWGALRDPATLEPYGPDGQPDLMLGRGFTGHEHLPWFGLVNMNARLYDLAVARWMWLT